MTKEEVIYALHCYAADLIVAGASRLDVFRKLAELGIDAQSASIIVGNVESYFAQHPVPMSPPVTPQTVVPIGINLPHNFGRIETQVSPETADTVGKVVVGGLLVAAGVFLAAFLGSRLSGGSDSA
ncbi:MAG: hypothetical protein NZ700_08495 [Gemmataceae bacterium]|nr:hypothetical protein [Gemmataceae bacterium]MDW8266570.1 hypothetical protein [Gemmataceae bacterium]